MKSSASPYWLSALLLKVIFDWQLTFFSSLSIEIGELKNIGSIILDMEASENAFENE